VLIPTRRLLFLALCGLVPLVLTSSYGAAFLVGLAWLAAVVVIALIDGWFSLPSEALVWSRDHDQKLSLGAWNPVSLTLENRSRRALRLEVRDAVPSLLVPDGDHGGGECAPFGTWTLHYRVFPIHRGDYRFGAAGVRYLGPLGLAWWQRKLNLDDAVKVYPNLLAIRSYEALIRRGQLEEIGLRNSRRWGSGTEFERLREYTPDDEYRRINWKATARRNKPIAVDYQTERSQNVLLVLDSGRLMSTRVPLEGDLAPADDLDRIIRSEAGAAPVSPSPTAPRALTRLDYAVNASVLLAYVSHQYGDRVGLLAFSDRVTRFIAPAPGRRQFLRIAEALYNLEAEETEADYAEGLGYLAARNPRRSLAVVFTDIAEPEAATILVSHLGHLARRHLPLVVTLRDPGVEKLAIADVTSPEATYERAVAQRLLDDREQTLRFLRQRGALTLDTPADRLSPSLINRYLEIKARARL
jgi:uncharacterized protein (DUF58 family)